MKAKNLEELIFLYKSGINDISVDCISCGQEFSLTKTKIQRNLKNSEKLVKCRSCNFNDTISNRTSEDRTLMQEKRKKTNLEKYGCENAFQLEKVKELSRKRDWTDRNNKSRQTCLEKYGVDNVAKTDFVKDKINKTLIDRYGSVEESYKQRQLLAKKTNLEKRGHDSNFKDEDFHKKSIQTQIEKYGRAIYSRNYIYNDVCFDSSWELAYYIYLVDHNINFEYQPKVEITYIGEDNLKHNYYPDFKVDNKLQEIKGNQFFNENNEPFCKITNTWWKEKYDCMLSNNIEILREQDLSYVFDYIKQTYGNDYLSKFKK
jgi:hypothetical protein